MAGLTSEQKQQYDDLGYVLLEGLFEPSELQPLIDEIDTAVDRVARSYHAEERIRSTYEDEGFERRFMRLVDDAQEAYDELVGSVLMGPELFAVLSHARLLDIVEGIVGPEVHCEGRHRLRPKLPNYGVADFRWHEDTAYAAKRITYVQQQYGLGAADARAGGRFMSRIVAAPQMPEPNFWIPLVPVNEGERLPPRPARRPQAYTALRGAVGAGRVRSRAGQPGAPRRADESRGRAAHAPARAPRFAAQHVRRRTVERRHPVPGRTEAGQVGARAGFPGTQRGAPGRRV